MNFFKKIFKLIIDFYRSILIKKAFRERHRNIYNNGEYVKVSLTAEEKKNYLEYWRPIYKNVNLETVELAKSFSGKFDKRIVPEEVFDLYIQPKFKKYNQLAFLANKSVYNKWFEKGLFPHDYFHKINSTFYDSSLNLIYDIESYIDNIEINFPVVLKPSVDSKGGANIYFLFSKGEIINKLYSFENFVLQEKIKQNNKINEIYSGSINTVRVCLLKRPSNSKVVFLNASLRMGKDGSLDNASAGGIVCNINENGEFNKYAIDKLGRKYFKHPNSNVIFEGLILPYYDELQQVSIKIAEQTVFANLISLDMCLDQNNKWRCIEINLKFQTIRFAQYAGTPFFGKYTEEVINFCK